MLIWLFLIAALAAAASYMYFGGVGVGKALLLFVGSFVALNLLYLVFFGIVALFVNNTKPIAKQSQICRAGCVGVAGLLTGYCWIRTHISGLEKLPDAERFVLVCNHRSGFDPLIVMDKLRRFNISFISKPSNMLIPIAGRLAYGAGFLSINRENNREALKTILLAADYLRRGLCSIGIYPEGTRSRTGDMLPFHPGSFKIAQKAGAPLVIACVKGSENVKANVLRRPTDVYLEILQVLPAERVQSMNTAELSLYSREVMQRALA